MTSVVQNLPSPPDPVRQRLAQYFTALAVEGEEGLLATKGVEKRSSSTSLIMNAAMRAAESFAFLRALLPDSTILPANPDDVTRALLLAPLEVSELAVHHDNVAAACERQGDHDGAQRRRDRAYQLRALFSGVAI